MAVWVKVVQPIDVRNHGKITRYYPGDWVELSNQHALRLSDESKVEIVDKNAIQQTLHPTTTIVTTGNHPTGYLEKLNLPIVTRPKPELVSSENIIIGNYHKLRLADVVSVVKHLSIFDVAVPLFSYDQLACHVGSERDRVLTGKVLPDMRIPLYNTNLMFVRQNETTEVLFKEWQNETHDCLHHAFMRAYYQVKPVLLALPVGF